MCNVTDVGVVCSCEEGGVLLADKTCRESNTVDLGANITACGMYTDNLKFYTQ